MLKIPGRIPISIHPLFWATAFLLGWLWGQNLQGAFLYFFVIFFSVLLHEFGHALTAVFFKQEAKIQLAIFGGFTYREGEKLKLWKEFIVVLNGPLTSLAISFVSYLVLKNFTVNPIVKSMLNFSYFVNLFWAIVNLIPVLPLDGGHLLSIVLEGIFGFKGIKAAIVIGVMIAAFIAIISFIARQFLLGALFLLLAFESFRSLKYYKIFNEHDRDQSIQKKLQEARDYRVAGNMNKALAAYEEVRQKAEKGVLYVLAAQEMAAIYNNKKEFAKAYELLLPLQKYLSSSSIPLLHYLAFQNGDIRLTLQLANQSYQIQPNYETALINACAHGLLQEVEPAVGWLECCIRDKIPSISQAMSRSEFDQIRDEPKFVAFRQKLEAF